MRFLDAFENVSTTRHVVDHGKAALGGGPWGVAGLGADAVGIAQQLIPRAAPTPVIRAGLLGIAAFNWACGVATPDDGERFADGASQFDDVGRTLDSAFPERDWEGSGSHAYARQNTTQHYRSQTMANTDIDIAQIIARQAGQLNDTRSVLDRSATVLGYSIVPAIAALAIPVVGKAVSLGIEIGAVAGTVPACQVKMLQMAADALQNSQDVQRAVGVYDEVASAAQPNGTPSDFAPPMGTVPPPGCPSTDPHQNPETPSAPSTSAPPSGGAGGASGGGASSDGGGPSAGTGSGSSTPALPAMPEIPDTPTTPSSTGIPSPPTTGASIPSLPAGGASGGVGSGASLLAGLTTLLAQAAQQAQQTRQRVSKLESNDAEHKARDEPGDEQDDAPREAAEGAAGERAPIAIAKDHAAPQQPSTAASPTRN